jgi:hypothetical protein
MIYDLAFAMLFWLLLKHYLFDFVLQFERHLLHKDLYGDRGAMEHAGLHGLGTFLVFLWGLDLQTAAIAGAVDAVVHYHIDWLKAKVTLWSGANPSDREFWILFGMDQALHQVTYLALVVWLLP